MMLTPPRDNNSLRCDRDAPDGTEHTGSVWPTCWMDARTRAPECSAECRDNVEFQNGKNQGQECSGTYQWGKSTGDLVDGTSRRGITAGERGELHKYLERNRPQHWSNGARTVPYDALLATEAPMSIREYGTTKIDSQHPCTYEHVGPANREVLPKPSYLGAYSSVSMPNLRSVKRTSASNGRRDDTITLTTTA